MPQKTLHIHYHRPRDDYRGWTLWVWDPLFPMRTRSIRPKERDDFGLHFVVPRDFLRNMESVALIPRKGDWVEADAPDRLWDLGGGMEAWMISGQVEISASRPWIPPRTAMQLQVVAHPAPLIVHYHRADDQYDGWQLWSWDAETGRNSRALGPSGRDDFGLVFEIPTDQYGRGVQVGLVPRRGEWTAKDGDDRIWTLPLGPEVWMISGRAGLFTRPPDFRPRVSGAFLDGPHLISVHLGHPLPDEKAGRDSIEVRAPGGVEVPVVAVGVREANEAGITVLDLELGRAIDVRREPAHRFMVGVAHQRPAHLTVRGILDREEFQSRADLGALYAPDQTIFRVFAPTASSVEVRIYEEPFGGEPKVLPMAEVEGGVWEAVCEGDLEGAYYTMRADGNDPRFLYRRELTDPYARATTAFDGRGLVVASSQPPAPGPVFDLAESVVYELHVRDFTIDPDSGIEQKGLYLGMTEAERTLAGEESTPIPTGLDHLAELGVNVVQVMPVHEFALDPSSGAYAWGYMPVHFNAPAGWYASRQEDATRVSELKAMIDALHRRGIKVVLDVVYNHTAEDGDRNIYNFAGLAPGYYYRSRSDGTFSNGSGCGNEFRTEAPMARRFILDSLRYWMTEFGVDGFRFDLLGLIDLETMEAVVRELRAIRKDVLVYGEPWLAGETTIEPTLKGAQRAKGFSVFDDHFRDALTGSASWLESGFVQGAEGIHAVKAGIQGSIHDFAHDPVEAIHYVACHDNLTLWDRIALTTGGVAGVPRVGRSTGRAVEASADRREHSSQGESERGGHDDDVTNQDRIRMNKLATALVLTSQGIPFLHSGQEMLRTKGGEHNSYDKPDEINMIRWIWKRDNHEVFEYVRDLILLRRAHPMFRFATRGEVEANLQFLDDHLGMEVAEGCIAYLLKRGETGDEWQEAVVLVNPLPHQIPFVLPAGDWRVAVDGERVLWRADGGKESPNETPAAGGKSHTVPPRSLVLLFR